MEKISRILLVVPNYQEIKAILEKNEYHIEKIVDNGEDALRAVNSGVIDLVFVHINLNGEMNGEETINSLLSHHRMPIFLITNQEPANFVSSKKVQKVMGVIYEPIHEPTLLSTMELGFDRFQDYLNLFNEAKKYKNFVEEGPSATAIFQKGFCRFANTKFSSIFSEYCEQASLFSTFRFLKVLEKSIRRSALPQKAEAVITRTESENLNQFLDFHDQIVDLPQTDGTVKTLLYKSRSHMFKERIAHIVTFIELPSGLIVSGKQPPPEKHLPLLQPSSILPSENSSESPEINIIPEFITFGQILGNFDQFLILECLRTRHYDINELAVIIGKSPDTVYKHLRFFTKKKVLIAWRDGHVNKYSFNPAFFQTLVSNWRSFYASLELWFGDPL